jgi:hypothetical protein
MKKVFWGFFVLSFLLISSHAMATTIYYDLTNLGGGTWEYKYTVENDTASDIWDFVIYFSAVSDPSVFDYSNIMVTGNPDLTNWDIITAEPSVPDLGGYFDALALNTPIAPGDSLDSFKVSFDYAGTGVPGAQDFDIYDYDFNLVDRGTTQQSSIPTPEPTTCLLVVAGLISLAACRKKF